MSIRDYDKAKANPDCVKHYKLRNMDDGGYYIAARRPFKMIKDLVEHYKSRNVKLAVVVSLRGMLGLSNS